MQYKVFMFPLLVCAMATAIAAPGSSSDPQQDAINQRQQQQQNQLNAAIAAQQVTASDVRLQGETLAEAGFPQHEAQCFTINQLVLTDYQAEEKNSSASSLKLIQPSQFSWALSSVYAERDFADRKSVV